MCLILVYVWIVHQHFIDYCLNETNFSTSKVNEIQIHEIFG